MDSTIRRTRLYRFPLFFALLFMAAFVPVSGMSTVPASSPTGEAATVAPVPVNGMSTVPASSPAGEAATVAPCIGSGCSEGCTSGSNCHAYAKCTGGTCWPTVQTKNCRGSWMF